MGNLDRFLTPSSSQSGKHQPDRPSVARIGGPLDKPGALKPLGEARCGRLGKIELGCQLSDRNAVVAPDAE
jgi:hypothetical protein